MEQKHNFFTTEIKLGRKGQLTIPKIIRDEDNFEENDVFKITHYPTGTMLIEKKEVKTPEMDLFEFLDSLPPFDADKAWKEVEEERKKEHR